jgi:hypothetical protein
MNHIYWVVITDGWFKRKESYVYATSMNEAVTKLINTLPEKERPNWHEASVSRTRLDFTPINTVT